MKRETTTVSVSKKEDRTESKTRNKKQSKEQRTEPHQHHLLYKHYYYPLTHCLYPKNSSSSLCFHLSHTSLSFTHIIQNSNTNTQKPKTYSSINPSLIKITMKSTNKASRTNQPHPMIQIDTKARPALDSQKEQRRRKHTHPRIVLLLPITKTPQKHTQHRLSPFPKHLRLLLITSSSALSNTHNHSIPFHSTCFIHLNHSLIINNQQKPIKSSNHSTLKYQQKHSPLHSNRTHLFLSPFLFVLLLLLLP